VISFFVNMVPVAKARARVTRKGTYTPKKTEDAERLIAWECKKAMAGAKPLEGPVKLIFTAFFPIPKSWPKKKQAEARWHVVKPDSDNIEKLLKDALTHIAWKDDCQVAFCTKLKRYVWSKYPDPGLWIEFGEL
jgi:Holliday junction resolvase RusA-like endonuclease